MRRAGLPGAYCDIWGPAPLWPWNQETSARYHWWGKTVQWFHTITVGFDIFV